ncbi:F-box/kelch-repeat protein At3g23880-like [Salvia miltiorrhiza]|uniref:F-box/kelch-repeat protein At3g23880-like n=1 Tax=Salvia miltiorrhiza TaxID=226208 RepID=UPI0025AC0802|nr:F-box/kelch-repeat protein At3g23880-like [Salvia miltiorrhiza]
MKPDFFKNLPREIISEIFFRLPVVSIPISKCVCKRWLHLLESDAFVKSHFARSAPALVLVEDSGRLKVLELEGELNLHLDPLTQCDFPYRFIGTIRNCFNGFLVLRVGFDMLCVCNPITREVIKLDLPSDPQNSFSDVSGFGFGTSKITGQYKVVCIHSKPYDDKLDCHVYTLGTGSWRRLVNVNPYMYHSGSGAFVNGNLHWIATIGEASWISCFDVETECFSFFKAPPHHAHGLPFIRGRSISASSGCLWFCKVASEYEFDIGRCELTIWIMKEYGVDESWSMEYVIPLDDGMWIVDTIEVCENGDLLMLGTVYFSKRLANFSERLFYYSNKTKTIQMIDLFGSDRVECGVFTPTLVSLKTLGLGVENVISF